MLTRIIFLAILTEALVELFFTAAPLQNVRSIIIKKTPWLRSIERGHLLECKYCMSIWIGAFVVIFTIVADCNMTRLFATAVIVARGSNYAHTMIGFLRDLQINSRLKR